MLLMDPVVDDVVVVELGGPGVGWLRLAAGSRLEAPDRPVPPTEEVAGHVAEAPLPHRARLGIAIRSDLGGKGAPELLVGADAVALFGPGGHPVLRDGLVRGPPQRSGTRQPRRVYQWRDRTA